MTDTPLDEAHARAEATGAEADRLAFWSRLAEAEMHVLLDGDAPRTVDVEGAAYALGFDRADRLAAFAEGAADTATLSGRRLAAMLAEGGAGLALNLPDAPSAQLLPPEAMAWLAETLRAAPEAEAARFDAVGPPGRLPEALIAALDAKLRAVAGLAKVAYLATAERDGRTNHVLALIDAAPGSEAALAGAVQEALALSGLEAGSLDVAFPRRSDPLAAALGRHGLRIDLPDPAPVASVAPGSDGPPRLR